MDEPISFRAYWESWINVPAGETNAEDPFGSKVRSKFAADDSGGKEPGWSRSGRKSAERRFGFVKKCRK